MIADLLSGIHIRRRGPQRGSNISAPVFDTNGQVSLSVTLQGYQEPLTRNAIEEFGRRLLDLTREVSDAAPSQP